MGAETAAPRKATVRDLLYFRSPVLWPTWPFIPVVRRREGAEDEMGVLYDCWSVGRRPGYSATVFLTNLFLMPKTEAEFLSLPKEVFDGAEEMAAAGWVVD